MKNYFLSALIFVSLFANAQSKFYPIEIKGKWGYMDQAGTLVIPAVYDLADDFNEGFAIVALHNLPCVINDKNIRVVDTLLYQFISGFSDGLAAARDFKQKKFYINPAGEKIISLPDDIYEARKFKNGFALVSKEIEEHTQKFNHDIVTIAYRFGYIDKSGKQAIDFIFEDADDFNKEGIARVKVNKKFGLINTKGEFILNAVYNSIGNYKEHKVVINENGKFGYADEEGKILIAPKFDLAFDFDEGLAAVWNSATKKIGFINDKGEQKISFLYDAVRPFSEGKAAVLTEGKWGFIDPTGKLILLNVFDNATIFSEGFCAVLVKKKWGFIDNTGRLVIPAEYDHIGSFENGIADVVYKGVSFYIDKRGNSLPKLGK